jgi:hypothetical protein
VITLAAHPWVGQRVPIVGTYRSHGHTYYHVLAPSGRQTCVREDWTDHFPERVVPSVGGQPVRLAPEALLRMARNLVELTRAPTQRPAELNSTSPEPHLGLEFRGIPDGTSCFEAESCSGASGPKRPDEHEPARLVGGTEPDPEDCFAEGSGQLDSEGARPGRMRGGR